MTSLSTHVLDTATGRPAAGLAVELTTDDGTPVARGETDADGRVAPLAGALEPGGYRLRFDTAAHLGEGAFYPEVVVAFTVAAGEDHYHVPLLLSPFGYSTYRGS